MKKSSSVLTLVTLQELLSPGWVTATVLELLQNMLFTTDSPVTSPCCPLLHRDHLGLSTNTSCLDKYNGLLVDLASSVFSK